jgi:hypothetical protein
MYPNHNSSSKPLDGTLVLNVNVVAMPDGLQSISLQSTLREKRGSLMSGLFDPINSGGTYLIM